MKEPLWEAIALRLFEAMSPAMQQEFLASDELQAHPEALARFLAVAAHREVDPPDPRV